MDNFNQQGNGWGGQQDPNQYQNPNQNQNQNWCQQDPNNQGWDQNQNQNQNWGQQNQYQYQGQNQTWGQQTTGYRQSGIGYGQQLAKQYLNGNTENPELDTMTFDTGIGFTIGMLLGYLGRIGSIGKYLSKSPSSIGAMGVLNSSTNTFNISRSMEYYIFSMMLALFGVILSDVISIVNSIFVSKTNIIICILFVIFDIVGIAITLILFSLMCWAGFKYRKKFNGVLMKILDVLVAISLAMSLLSLVFGAIGTVSTLIKLIKYFYTGRLISFILGLCKLVSKFLAVASTFILFNAVGEAIPNNDVANTWNGQQNQNWNQQGQNWNGQPQNQAWDNQQNWEQNNQTPNQDWDNQQNWGQNNQTYENQPSEQQNPPDWGQNNGW